MRPRPLIPKFLLVVLTAGVGAGAWVGVREEPGASSAASVPSSLVQRAVTATARARSATFEVTASIRSTEPIVDSTDFGVGAVNFAHHSSEVSVYTHQAEQQFVGSTSQADYHSLLHERETPRGSFLQMPQSVTLPWAEVPVSPLLGPFGAMSEAYVEVALAPLLHVPSEPAPRVSVHQSVGSVSTTVYSWTTHGAECYGSKGRYSQVSTSVIRMWLDRRGRIRKVQTSIHQVSSSPQAPVQRISGTTTLDFTSFGTPVTITTPYVPKAGMLSHSHIGVSKADQSTRCPTR